MSKFLDKAGLEHLLGRLSEHMGEGGGTGGSAGRIKLHGTEESPIKLDEILEPDSYMISGVIDGLPDDIAQLQDFLDEWSMALDVSSKIEWEEDEGGETFSIEILVQELKFMSLVYGHPVIYQRRVGIKDSFRDILPWNEILLSSFTDALFDRVGTVYNCIVQLSPVEYIISIVNVPENAFIIDMVLADNYLDEVDSLYPQWRLSDFDSLLKLNNLGEFVSYKEYNTEGTYPVLTLGLCVFNSEQRANDFLASFGSKQAYLVYQTKRVFGYIQED